MEPDAIQADFAEKIFATYLFPFCSGIYITFASTRWIQFQDHRVKAREAMKGAEKKIRAIPPETSLVSWSRIVRDAFEELDGLAELLRERGHYDAATTLQGVHDSFSRRVFDLSEQIAKNALVHYHFETDDEYYERKFEIENDTVHGIMFGIHMMVSFEKHFSEADKAIRAIRPSWVAVLGFKSLGPFLSDLGEVTEPIVRYLERREPNRSDCCSCCECRRRQI